MRHSSKQHRVRLVIWPAVLVMWVSGCNPSGPVKQREIPLNPKLKWFFYWGELDQRGENEEPNQGRPASGPIRYPVFATAGKVYVYSAHIKDGRLVRGLFAITFNPSALNYEAYQTFELPHSISALCWAASDQALLVISSTANSARVISQMSPLSEGLVQEEVLVEPDWEPWGVAAWPGRSGIVFYGKHPLDGVRGFYWRQHRSDGVLTDGLTDSLLYAVTLDQNTASGMSIRSDGRCLFFAQGAHQTRFFELDLTHDSAGPRVIAERAGGRGAVIPNPVNLDLVLLNYSFPGDANTVPQDHIELLNIETGHASDLNVRTDPTPNYYIANEHPSWSLDGRCFVFSAASFSGEQDRSSPTLWMYRDVP